MNYDDGHHPHHHHHHHKLKYHYCQALHDSDCVCQGATIEEKIIGHNKGKLWPFLTPQVRKANNGGLWSKEKGDWHTNKHRKK